MVIIQPFVYEKITAFKERVQIISKVNEIIEKINNGEIGISEDEVISLIENELLNYYTKAEVDNAIASIDLSDFYTKSETNGLLNLKRDISDSYNKTEIDSKVSVLSDRITENESDIGNLENTKQDNISVVEPVLMTNNEISLDETKVIINDQIINNDFVVKTGGNKKFEFRLGNSFSPLIIDYTATGSDHTIINPGSITFNPNGSEGLDIIRFSAMQNAFGNLGSRTFRMCGFIVSSAYSKTATSLSELFWMLTIPNEDRTNPRLFVGDRSYNGSADYTIRGIDLPCKNSSSINDNYIVLGEKRIRGSTATDNKYIFKVDMGHKKLSVIDNNVESNIVIAQDLPAGKNLTDTVTFQDLVNLGIIKNPNN